MPTNGNGTGSYAGKVAFMTGAGSGIGRAAALAFAREGAGVVVADVAELGPPPCGSLIGGPGSAEEGATMDARTGGHGMEGTGRVAVVSGANRGIGLEVARQLARRGLTVVLGARDLAKGEEAARRLRADGLTVLPRQLDVADDASVARLVTGVEADLGRLDVLVNNAAILYDTWQRGVDADLAVVHQALETNLFGAWRLCRAAIPLMRRGGYGRIVNVSSGAGSLASMGGGTPAYSVSKAALNALTRILGAELRGAGILVNAVDPGWTATDMGEHGGRPVEDGARGVVWAATLPDDGPTGGFFYDGEPEPW